MTHQHLSWIFLALGLSVLTIFLTATYFQLRNFSKKKKQNKIMSIVLCGVYLSAGYLFALPVIEMGYISKLIHSIPNAQVGELSQQSMMDVYPKIYNNNTCDSADRNVLEQCNFIKNLQNESVKSAFFVSNDDIAIFRKGKWPFAEQVKFPSLFSASNEN